MKLSELKIGQTATVKKLNLSKITCKEFYELGLTEGVKVKLIRIAGFDGPYELYLRGFNLAIRRRDAENITVKI